MEFPLIQDLNLANNHIKDEGCRHLSEGLRANKSIVKLSLERCKLRAEAMEYIAAALVDNTALTELKLARNGIGDKGTQALVRSLESNKTLKVRSIEWLG